MSKEVKQHKWYWRSLNEVDQTPEFEQFLHREFPEAASEFPKGVSRRRWLQLMGASLALGAAGCRYEEEAIAPFARRPVNRVPGETRKFSGLYELGGVGYPLLVTSYDGRPIKVDGNPNHPDSNGASTTFAQAYILDLYDPDRSRGVKTAGSEGMIDSDWNAFGEAVTNWLTDPESPEGAGIAILAQQSSSPSRIAQKAALLAKYPQLKWFEYDPVPAGGTTGGTEVAFGEPLRMHLDLAKASVIVSIDADPIGDDVGSLRNAQGWAKGRDVDAGKVNRLYAVESQFSVTGMSADHRMPLKSGQVAGFLAALVAEVKRRDGGDGAIDESLPKREKMLAAMAQDLVDNKGKGAVISGSRQPAKVQAMVHRLNVMLGNVADDGPVSFARVPSTTEGAGSIAELVQAINADQVRGLIVLEGNPVYDAPGDLGFAEAYSKVPNRVHLSLYEDETSLASTWHLNLAHPLETWSDARAYDGSWCIGQPQIDTIWQGRSVIELLAWMASGSPQSGRDIVWQTARTASADLGDETTWKKLVHDGFLPGPAERAAVTEPTVDLVGDDAWKTATPETDVQDLELVITPSGTLYDGRFANNGWLQECPDSITKVTWDNVALIAPSTAEELAVKQDTLVSLKLGDQEVELPAHIQPGQARGCIGVALGYGRTEVGMVGGSESEDIPLVGKSLYGFLKHGQGFVFSGLSVSPTDRPHRLAVTQDHHAIDETGLREINRRVGELVRVGDWSDLELFQNDEHAWLEKHQDHGSHEESDSDSDEAKGGAGLDLVPIALTQEDESKEGAEAEKHSDDKEHDDKEHAKGDDHGDDHGEGEEHEGDDDHGHGEHHHWPYHHAHFENINLNDGPGYEGARWGMSIDLNKCTGCNACVVACQAENNIPVVGKQQVIMGREMHWLRIDRYYTGEDYDDPDVVTQPVTCHHCENAPCEQVCPVAATVHSDEGLNDMIYNRCIGTRYCGNNCPYKVRRFNYLNYSEAVTFLKYPWADKLTPANRALRNLVMNPEVTVRSRGVMEKCTYCVQRIQNTKIQAKREGNRPIGPNEVTTACQEVCPTQAIAFGDLENEKSRVAMEHAKPRAYGMLSELNVRPRTKYLARVRNQHPALKDAETTH